MVLNANNILQERVRCAQDPVYYLNNYGYVFDAKQKKVSPMTCFAYQEKCVKDFHRFQNNIVLKSRQTGLSVVTAGYVAWKLMFRYDEKILIIANEGAGARRFLATVKQFIENTPKWLQPDSIITNNQTKLEFSNNSWVEAKASSPNAGRGESLTMLILDETAFIKDDQDIWMGAGMALSATKGKCIMISTPNGTGNLYHQTWVGAINKENDFNALNVHWTENPNSSVGLKWTKSTDGEIDVPWSPWYEEQCRRLGYDSVKIAQELDLSFEGSKYLAIEGPLVEKYEKRLKKKIPPRFIKYDFLSKGTTTAGRFTMEETTFYVWKEPELGKKYILSADVSRGDGKDELGFPYSVSNGLTTRTFTNRQSVLSVRLSEQLNFQTNRAKLIPTSIELFTSTATVNAYWELVLQRGYLGENNLGGGPTWTSLSGSTSPIEYSRNGTTVSGGEVIDSGFLSTTNQSGVRTAISLIPGKNFLANNYSGNTSDWLHLVVTPSASSSWSGKISLLAKF